MTLNIKELPEICEKIASLFKIEAYDIFGFSKEENSASAKEKKPFSLNASQKTSLTLRVWNENHQLGMASTSNFTEEGLQAAFRLAFHATAFWDNSIQQSFSPLCLKEIQWPDEVFDHSFSPIQELSKAVIECESKILNSHPSLKSVPYNKIGELFYEQFYLNSSGAFRHAQCCSAHCYFYPLAQEGLLVKCKNLN